MDANGQGRPQEQFISVTIIYNGQPKPRRFNVHEPLRAAFQWALQAFGIRPPDATNLGFFFNGNELDLSKNFIEANIPHRAEIILQPRRQRGG